MLACLKAFAFPLPIDRGYLLNPLDAKSNYIAHLVNQSTNGSTPGAGDLPIRAGPNVSITFSNGGMLYIGANTNASGGGGTIVSNNTVNIATLRQR